MRMGVIYYPNPILEGVSNPVNLDSIGEKAFRLLIDNMIETARDYRAEGLAAVQVGFSMRMFVMRTDDDEGAASQFQVFINTTKARSWQAQRFFWPNSVPSDWNCPPSIFHRF